MENASIIERFRLRRASWSSSLVSQETTQAIFMPADELVQMSLSVGVVTVGLMLLGLLIYASVTVDETRLAMTVQAHLSPKSFFPEPAERLTFLLSLLLAPCALLWLCKKRWNVPPSLLVIFILSGVGIGISAFAFYGDKGYYLQGSLFKFGWWAFGPILVVVAEGLLRFGNLSRTRILPIVYRTLRVLLFVLLVFFLVLSFYARIFGPQNPYVVQNHFEAAFFTISQIVLGNKTLLVNANHQYGLYPEILAPLFHLLGGISVVKYTLVMSTLVAIVHLSWLAATMKLFRSSWLGGLTYLGAFLIFEYFGFLLDPNDVSFYDPYFQYMPIRTIFPSLLVLVLAYFEEWELDRLSGVRRFIGMVFGLGVLWNLDSGLPVLGTWVLFLAYRRLLRDSGAPLLARDWKSAFWIALEPLVGLGFVVIGFTFMIWCKSGSLPDFISALNYQKEFYGSGFMMLPMRLNHSWILLALIYLFGLAFALRTFWMGDSSPERKKLAEQVFTLTVLGCGLFSYYQGRSHDVVFPGITLPGFMLVGLAIDRALLPAAEKRTDIWRRIALYAVVAYVLVFASVLVCAVRKLPPLATYTSQLWKADTSKLRYLGALEHLKMVTKPGDQALILSTNAAVYHAESQTSSPMKTSLIELLSISDLDDLLLTIRSQPRVFVDGSVSEISNPSFNQRNGLIFSLLEKHFQPITQSENGYLLEYRPLSPAASSVQPADGAHPANTKDRLVAGSAQQRRDALIDCLSVYNRCREQCTQAPDAPTDLEIGLAIARCDQAIMDGFNERRDRSSANRRRMIFLFGALFKLCEAPKAEGLKRLLECNLKCEADCKCTD